MVLPIIQEQVMTEKDVWIKTDLDKIKSLIADEAKNADMLNNIFHTTKQMQAKSRFRLALLNQLLETLQENELRRK